MTLIDGQSVKIEKGESKNKVIIDSTDIDEVIKDVLNDSQGQNEIQQRIIEKMDSDYDFLQEYKEANNI